jgi:uncharacterized protein (TIGR00661 family)
MKILYGVPGEGMGHATRSKVIIEHLLKKHDVRIVSSAKAFQFLEKNFPGRVTEIKGFHFAFDEKKVSKAGTLMLNLKNLPSNLNHNIRKYFFLDKIFHPDLVISDFESFSYFLAKYHRLPLISIDNMQVMDRCKREIVVPSHERENARLAKAIVRAKVPSCDHYLISTFFDAEVIKSKTSVVPPIIRNEILKAKPTYGRHVVVYQTGTVLSHLIQVLKEVRDVEFRVYGSGKDERQDNVILKPFSEDEFLADFASAAAVIANGGYSFISEAVYLRKPVLSVPLEGQYEQFMNAAYIEKLGYGRHFDTMTSDAVKAFLYDIEIFRLQLSHYHQDGNRILLDRVDAVLEEVRGD